MPGMTVLWWVERTRSWRNASLHGHCTDAILWLVSRLNDIVPTIVVIEEYERSQNGYH